MAIVRDPFHVHVPSTPCESRSHHSSSLVARLFGHEDAAHAGDLKIDSVSAFTATDWPGVLAATVMTQGCPWRCTYCFRPGLQPSRVPSKLEWSQVAHGLAKREALLDGVVFSGGEPTRQAALVPAMRHVAALGYKVGLHSSGAFPQRLREALPQASWLALDIKATPWQYPGLTGSINSGQRAYQALEVALEWAGELEVRLTVDPVTHTAADVLDVAERVRAAGGPKPVLQQAVADGTSAEYREQLAGRTIHDVLTDAQLAGFTVRQ